MARLSAVKWTAKGNLVLTANHLTTQAQLTNAAPLIKQIAIDSLKAKPGRHVPDSQIRPNKPSWIRAPDSLGLQTASSLVMAFEDPDGSKKRDLLSTKQLFAFGVQAKPASEQQPLKVAGDEDLMLQDPQTRTVHVPDTRKRPTSPNSPLLRRHLQALRPVAQPAGCRRGVSGTGNSDIVLRKCWKFHEAEGKPFDSAGHGPSNYRQMCHGRFRKKKPMLN
ncbi:hypothetical protein BJV74DRAFT_799764 [Russula compacta]|nr:hypothetical protein BJV74DRAFT_799764 [Russula compacta]